MMLHGVMDTRIFTATLTIFPITFQLAGKKTSQKTLWAWTHFFQLQGQNLVP